ncbi:MAG: hypothetical protein V4615_18010 [Bacteroidota bacterium]
MILKLVAGIFLWFQFWGSGKELDTVSHDHILVGLGMKVDSKEFKEFKQYWDIDRSFENPAEGIKLYVNSITGKVEGVLIADDREQSKARLERLTSILPFGISFDDDTASLFKNLGYGQKIIGKNAFKFYQDELAIEVLFSDWKNEKIASINFFNESKRFALPTNSVEEVKKESAASVKMKEGLKHFDQMPVPSAKAEKMDTASNFSDFKQAILNVFKSYDESSFCSIKTDTRGVRNFWNYRYTYSTKLKIPGEKFNMLYCFPFVSSPLDFVSVIKESDSYDKSIETAYKNFEKKLTENFTEKDGWIATCIPNKESRTVTDLEFRNDKYGAIILDYSKNPNGRHVVYLRFLLFSS